MDAKYVQHAMPQRGIEPNHVIEGRQEYDGVQVTEQLWSRRISSNEFEMLSLPFYLYGVALGDHVTPEQDGHLRVVQESGRGLYRIFFPEAHEAPESFDDELAHLGARTEWFSRRYVAVDCPEESIADLDEWLAAQRELDRFSWERAN